MENLLYAVINNQFMVLCFIIACPLIMAGLFISTLSSSQRLSKKGECLLFGGVLLAGPATMNIFALIVGDSALSEIFPTWFLMSFYIVIPVLGACVAFFGWNFPEKLGLLSDV